MKAQSKELKNDGRETEILNAALVCFLKFGYSKTSLDDIAKEAGLSRTLLYLSFKNKKEIFRATFGMLINPTHVEFNSILKQKKTKRELVLALYELVLLEPWDKISKQPMFQDFYETCEQVCPDLSEKHEAYILEKLTHIFKDSKISEIFALSVIGLYSDVPDTKTLRKRFNLLVDTFLA